MAYRIGKNVTFRQMFIDIYRFLREMTSISEVNYESSNGDGELLELSVPAESSTTETWTLKCTDDTYPAKFSVMGNITGYTDDAYVDSHYDNGIISFTIKDGVQKWVVGDVISFSTKTAVYTPWRPRTIGVEDAPITPPLVVAAIQQKKPQFGSEWLGALRGNSILIDGPKNNSWAMRPLVKSGVSEEYSNMYQTPTADKANYVAYGGTGAAPSLGNLDAEAPQNFTIQLYTKNVNYMAQALRNPVCGEILYSVVDYNTYGGTIKISLLQDKVGIGMNYQFSSMGSPSFNYVSTKWSTEFSIGSYLAKCGKSIEDWFLLTVRVDRDNNKIDLFIDKEFIGTYEDDDINLSRPVFGGIGSFGDVADPVIWKGLLPDQTISDIYDSSEAVNPLAPEIYDAFMWDTEVTLPLIDIENNDNLENIITAQMFPNQHPYYSYRFDSLHQTAVIRDDIDPEIQHMNSLYFDDNTHQWYDKESHPEVYILGEHPTRTVIDKYWVVATNEYIAGVIKIFDQASPQQVPVYQSFYIGRGDSLQDKLYTAVVGVRNTYADFWYSSSDGFKSGYYYRQNVRWFGQWLWQLPTRISAPAHRDGYISSGNSFNVWQIYHGSNYAVDTETYSDEKVVLEAWGDFKVYDTYGVWAPELMGTFYGIYGIQALEVTPEDLVIIDGIEYLAYTDCTQSGKDSMLLLRLE